MKDEKLRKILNKYGEENEATFLLLDGFDGSIIGVSHDHRVIYDYHKMIKEFADYNKCSEEEAEEFIQYNTLRALPYYNDKDGNKPIIIELSLEELEMYYSD